MHVMRALEFVLGSGPERSGCTGSAWRGRGCHGMRVAWFSMHGGAIITQNYMRGRVLEGWHAVAHPTR